MRRRRARSSVCAEAALLDGEASAAFGSARVNHGAATGGLHAHQKTMGLLATGYGGLVGTFHGGIS